MSIGSVPWYWAVCLLCSTLHALPVESNCKGLKDLMEGGGKKQSHVLSNCGKDPKGGQVFERVEAYCQIKSDRHSPDCKAIGSLTFDR